MDVREVRGVGIGLRWALVGDLLERPPAELRWLEIAPENFMRRGGRWPAALAACRERWPVVTHGLAMSLGGAAPLDDAYLATLRGFLRDVKTPWHSDHLCFSAAHGAMLHDLLPLPFTLEAAEHVARRLREAALRLDVPMAIENVTWYAQPDGSEMDEGDFVTEVVRRSGARLLLDVNNVYVNAKNHGFDARAVLAKMPLDQVVQIHVAGHEATDEMIVDTHAADVCDEVYDLLAWTLERTGPVPVLLERDDRFPDWEVLSGELRRLDAIWRRAAREDAA